MPNGTSLAWHFVNETLRDLRPIPPDGEWLIHDGNVAMCQSGLHASFRLLEAMELAPGPICCRVEVADIVDRDYEKLVCRRRRILWRVRADEVLRAFARWCAYQVVHLWEPSDVVTEFIRTGNMTLAEQVRSECWSVSSRLSVLEGLTEGEIAEASSIKAAARSAAWSATTATLWETSLAAAHGASMSAAWAIVWWSGTDNKRRDDWMDRKGAVWSAVRNVQEMQLADLMETAARKLTGSAD